MTSEVKTDTFDLPRRLGLSILRAQQEEQWRNYLASWRRYYPNGSNKGVFTYGPFINLPSRKRPATPNRRQKTARRIARLHRK